MTVVVHAIRTEITSSIDLSKNTKLRTLSLQNSDHPWLAFLLPQVRSIQLRKLLLGSSAYPPDDELLVWEDTETDELLTSPAFSRLKDILFIYRGRAETQKAYVSRKYPKLSAQDHFRVLHLSDEMVCRYLKMRMDDATTYWIYILRISAFFVEIPSEFVCYWTVRR